MREMEMVGSIDIVQMFRCSVQKKTYISASLAYSKVNLGLNEKQSVVDLYSI